MACHCSALKSDPPLQYGKYLYPLADVLRNALCVYFRSRTLAQGKKARRGDDSDDDINDDEDVEGSLSRGVESLSVNDDKPAPPASGGNKAALKMSKKDRRKAEAAAMAAAAVAEVREDGQDTGDGEDGQEEVEGEASAAEMAAAEKKKVSF